LFVKKKALYNLVAVTSTELRKFWHRSPFVPFDITVPGRTKLHVPHPDFFTISPSGRVAHVWTKADDYAALDVFLITAVEKISRNGKRRRGSARRS
jgi:hypothetical protein